MQSHHRNARTFPVYRKEFWDFHFPTFKIQGTLQLIGFVWKFSKRIWDRWSFICWIFFWFAKRGEFYLLLMKSLVKPRCGSCLFWIGKSPWREKNLVQQENSSLQTIQTLRRTEQLVTSSGSYVKQTDEKCVHLSLQIIEEISIVQTFIWNSSDDRELRTASHVVEL